MASSRQIIDTHVHLWTLSEFKYDWPTSDMKIYRDFTFVDYKNDIKNLVDEKNVEISGCVYVQVLNNYEETEKLIELSKQEPLLKGIVGWVDLKSENVDTKIKQLKESANGKLVGFRHIIEGEGPNWLVQPEVKRGLEAIYQNGLCYDLLTRPAQLKNAVELASFLPNMTFIVDHISKPRSGRDEYDQDWHNDLIELAKHENVYCKLSGLVNEATDNWSFERFEPYLNHVLDNFGWQRCMFGNDWPVFWNTDNCHITHIFQLVDSMITKKYSNEANFEEIWNSVFYNNGVKAYKLNL